MNGAIKFRYNQGDHLVPFNYDDKIIDLIEKFKKEKYINSETSEKLIFTFCGKVLDPKRIEPSTTARNIKLKNNSIIQVSVSRSLVGGNIDLFQSDVTKN